jgi:hypothetical protein
MRWLILAAMLPSVALAQMPAAPAVIVTGQTSVGDALVQIVAARPRVNVEVTVDRGSECYIGLAGTTSATGYPLRSGQSVISSASAGLYAVCATPATIGYLELLQTGA